MALKRDCPLCGEELEDAPAIHDVALCEKTELLKGREIIKNLKVSLQEWKYGVGGWFELHDQIGKLSWQHHDYVCPHILTAQPEISPNPWLHPGEQFVQQGKCAYARTVDGWKLIGVGSSEAAAEAVVRLMTMEKTNEDI